MYVTVVGSGHGCTKKYVLIKESYRDANGKPKSRTAENLGSLEALLEKDPQALVKLKTQYADDRADKRGASADVRARRIQAQLEAVKDSHLPIPLVRYGHFPLRRIWMKDLKLDVKIRQLQLQFPDLWQNNME